MCLIQLKCCWDLDYLIDIPYCLLEVTDSSDSWFHLDLLEPKTFVMGVGMAVKCLIARKYSVLLRSIHVRDYTILDAGEECHAVVKQHGYWFCRNLVSVDRK